MLLLAILSVAVSLGRSNEYDSELRALDGLLVSGVPVTLIYISKVVVHCLIMALVQALTLLVLPTLLTSVEAARLKFIKDTYECYVSCQLPRS